MKKKGPVRRFAVRVSSTDHVRGSPFATVTLIGYGDFSNPDCSRAHRTVKTIQKKMGSRLRYIFRSFPESSIFDDAEASAEAAECASSQGKFWEMHDRIFEDHCISGEFQLARCARAAGLNVREFQRAMRDHVNLPKIRAGKRAGVRQGVLRAPTFFINSRLHESSFGMTTLLPAIQAAAGGA